MDQLVEVVAADAAVVAELLHMPEVSRAVAAAHTALEDSLGTVVEAVGTWELPSVAQKEERSIHRLEAVEVVAKLAAEEEDLVAPGSQRGSQASAQVVVLVRHTEAAAGRHSLAAEVQLEPMLLECR